MPTNTGSVQTSSASTIDEWLQSIGLGRFRELFVAQEIDDKSLAEITEADLDRWGVPFGPRKRLMRAIAERVDIVRPSSRAVGDVERRQITAVYCDMVGSTELAGRSTPRTCAPSPATTSRFAAPPSRRSAATSPPTTVTARSPASVGPRRTRTIPNGRSMPP